MNRTLLSSCRAAFCVIGIIAVACPANADVLHLNTQDFTKTLPGAVELALGLNPNTSNPALGLRFGMSTGAKWSWDVPFQILDPLPAEVQGKTAYTPVAKLTPLDGAAFSTENAYDFYSKFYFQYHQDIPLLPDIDIDIDWGLPNISMPDFAVTAHGQGSVSGSQTLNAADIFHIPGHDPATGVYRLGGNSTPDNLWSIEADLLALTGDIAGMPVSAAAALAQALGFHAGAGGGMRAAIYNTWMLQEYHLVDPTPINFGDALGTQPYTVDGSLEYTAQLFSTFVYTPDLYLSYDLPGKAPSKLTYDLGNITVGSLASEPMQFTAPFHYEGVADVGPCLENSWRCAALPPQVFIPGGIERSIEGTIDGDTVQSNLPSENVVITPEPASFLLLGTIAGLLPVIMARRRAASRQR